MRKHKSNLNNLVLIRRIPLFSGLSSQSLRYIARIAKRKTFKKGKIIFTENTVGKTIYIVVSGQIKIFAQVSLHRKKTFVYLDRGEFFGELALLGAPTRSASAQAVSDCELLVIQQRDFYKILKSYPGVSLNLITVLSQRLRDADKEIESLSFYSVLNRVARVLLDLEKKYGKSTPHGRCLDLPLDKKDIAELVGTVREVATRALKQLTKFGCIKYIGCRIIIADKDKLQYITGLKS